MPDRDQQLTELAEASGLNVARTRSAQSVEHDLN